MILYIYDIYQHKILNKTLYSVTIQILKYLRKCTKKLISSNELRYSFINKVMKMTSVFKTAMPYIMIDLIVI